MKMENHDETLIAYSYWLDSIPGVGHQTARKLLELYGNARKIYEIQAKELEELRKQKIITKTQMRCIIQAKEEKVDIKYEMIQKRGIRCIPFGSEEYPKRLLFLADPPLNLYVMGSLPKEEIPTVGIVGARLCSDYGRYMARQFGMKLAAAGIQVVSGMALGVDGISQKAALDMGGASFGILGCGVDICYPQEHMDLYRQLSVHGGIVSEYVPGTLPKAGLFPMRNRIISGLSDLILVVEARQKSGTLITVDMALEQGKEVYALPGRVTDSLSVGCNNLIRQGAGIALSPKDIIDAVWGLWEQKGEYGACHLTNLPECREQEPGIRARLSREEAYVYELLSEEGKSMDELIEILNMKKQELPLTELYTLMMQLCIQKLAYQKNGRFYRGVGEEEESEPERKNRHLFKS